MFDLIVIILI